jgi:hypothetical protein
MRVRVSSTLISVAAGTVLAIAGTTAPAHAQSFGSAIASFFGLGGNNSAAAPNNSGRALASAAPQSLVSNAPLPPSDIPDAHAPSSQMASAPDDDAAAVGEATPLPPDTPVASRSLDAPKTPTTAADATLGMANMMDGAGGGVSNSDLMSSLEDAAAAGQPMALWRLGTMYENGEGVAKDDVKAFGYFSQIANDHADAAPRSVDADIVAQSFVKMGDYYQKGLPDAGVEIDPERAEQLILHAATYFGNADAQYRVGELYLDQPTDPNPLQGARWLSLAAHKGHIAAQAKLGDLLFNGAGLKAQPTEGLMWLSIAHDRSVGTPDESWVNELLTRDMLVATPDERAAAIKMAAEVEPQFGRPDDDDTDD